MTLRDIFSNLVAVLGHFYLLSLMHRFRQLHVSLIDSIVFMVITSLISEPVICQGIANFYTTPLRYVPNFLIVNSS